MHWHISLRFGHDVLRHGLDPLPFIEYLSTLGTIEAIVTLHDTMPTGDEMDPESCYLGFEIAFSSLTADKKTIESVFEFVLDDWRNIEALRGTVHLKCYRFYLRGCRPTSDCASMHRSFRREGRLELLRDAESGRTDCQECSRSAA